MADESWYTRTEEVQPSGRVYIVLRCHDCPGEVRLAKGGTGEQRAAQMLADIPGAQVGNSYYFRIINTGAGTLTLTADSGATVTMTGTMTVAQNTWRDFILTFNTAATATVQWFQYSFSGQ